MSRYEEIAGSGKLRVTTSETVKRAKAELEVQRTVEDMSEAFNARLDTFYSRLTGYGFSPSLIERVWVANRCQHLNCQQIATMPLRFYGDDPEPLWVASPDPVWYPNGIGDAVYAAMWSQYGWGDAFLLITARDTAGWPTSWTVLDPEPMDVQVRRGQRVYRSGNVELNSDDIVQISRDPTGGLRGTSALRSYSSYLYSLLAASNLERVMMNEGGIPFSILKSNKRLNPRQAEQLQTQWMDRVSVRAGAPAILPPEIDFQQLTFSPQDLMLLDVQGFDARVIASAYGVPPFLINMPLEGGLTYQNPETLFEVWWRTELRPAAFRLSRGLTSNMLPDGSWVEFDAREVLAPTFKDLTSSWVELGNAGHVSTDEIRAAVLNLGPLSETDTQEELMEPSIAAASPAQQPQNGKIAALRPTGTVT